MRLQSAPRWALALCLALMNAPAMAAELPGDSLGVRWALPFAGMLLSIAVMPLLMPGVWHRHFGKITAAWSLALLLPLAGHLGVGLVGGVLAHTLLTEYLPFIVLLTALFTTAGGIHVRGNLHGSPLTNTALLAVGAALASVMGTTGASMLMVRPLIRANDNRRHVAHVMVFFIFIVSNAGGALTPLGDPPLFLGFLKGVDFFWTLKHIGPQTLFLVLGLLAIFYLLDRYWFTHEALLPLDPTPDNGRLGLDGAVNFLPLAAVVALVLMSGLWKPGVAVSVAGVEMGLEQLVRDALLLVVIGVSLWITPAGVRARNQFSWGPMLEVAKLFVGIFLTMMPVLAMLKAGVHGRFAGLVLAASDAAGAPSPVAYFWLSGALSSFLDNAPTYLVFFNLAGGDPATLMTTLAPVLGAISAGSVFMGANTYIGNAPNFMVKAIAEERGLRMPSFFGYMAWSAAVLLPMFALITLIWFR
ncbi:sodium:proton antiporter [Ideonella margarita]